MRIDQKWRLAEQLCVLSIFLWLFFLSSCKPVETTASNASTPPPPGVVDDSKGFQVWTLNSTYTIHSDGKTAPGEHTYTAGMSWANPENCVATAGQDILCYIEAPELDLWFTGASIQYNVPSQMCEYMHVALPWYYSLPAGSGGKLVSYLIDNTLTAPVQGAIIDRVNSASGSPYCPFDYTAEGGPNCCTGEYTLSQTTKSSSIEVGDDGVTTVTNKTDTQNSPGFWGGSLSNCVAGGATKATSEKSTPLPLTQWSSILGSGLGGVMNIPSPMSMGLSGNTSVANYFDIAASAKNYDYYDSTSNTEGLQYGLGDGPHDLPPAIDQRANPILRASTVLPIPGSTSADGRALSAVGVAPSPFLANPFYSFTCYNHYQEVAARIRVMVRSWDSASKIKTATSYAPNYAKESGVGGAEPVHDRMTWGDLFFNYVRSNGTTSQRMSWANTTTALVGGVAANCADVHFTPGTIYTSSFPCMKATGMTATDGFPGWTGGGVPDSPPYIVSVTPASAFVGPLSSPASIPTAIVASFSKAMTPLVAADFTVDGNCVLPTVTNVAMTTRTSATATLSAPACDDAEYFSVTVDPTLLTSLGGTPGIGSAVTKTYTYDSVGPVPVVSASAATIVKGTPPAETLTITLSFTDAGVGGISLTSLLGTGVVGASGQGLVITDNVGIATDAMICTVTVAKNTTTATATLTVGSCTLAGTLTISIAAGVATDSLSNLSSASAVPAVTITVN